MGIEISSATIRDNGLRCFVPPCYSYDLIDRTGKLIRTVSDVVLQEQLSSRWSVEAIIDTGNRVEGTLQPYSENIGGMEHPGLRFIVTSITQ